MNKVPLYNLARGEMRAMVESWCEPGFHADQIWRWLYCSYASSFDEMSDLPLRLRKRLGEQTKIQTLNPVKELTSTDRKTRKILFQLYDGREIESVSMLQGRAGEGVRHTICVSAMAGCPIGCPFCATGQEGFERVLSAGEIVEQVMYFARVLREHPVANIVFMGMGEPLANYDATLKAIRTLNSPDGLNIGARHMTVSTSGLVPGIKRLAREGLQVGLAVSLHAPDDSLRSRLVPLNKRYPLKELLAACSDFFAATGRRVTFEYTLFQGVNDSPDQARQLAGLVRGMNCHINLIPANQTDSSAFRPSPVRNVVRFQHELQRHKVNATIRRSAGADIHAGCGQLRNRAETERANGMAHKRRSLRT
ncbi:MAG: 23S rRNA (adenine(2503)-C(2))-methyltransferase RlmN [Chloroflexi bacterium]|nr:23S rRNA (adenine(2503)-C(2))-methyltransferase RlmN [Chloroflexota bacterium]